MLDLGGAGEAAGRGDAGFGNGRARLRRCGRGRRGARRLVGGGGRGRHGRRFRRRGLAGEAQHRGGAAQDHLEVVLELGVAGRRLQQLVVPLHLVLEGLDELVARGLARDLEPGLAVQARRPLELVRDLAPQGLRRAGVRLALQRGEQERSRLHLDHGAHPLLGLVGVDQEPRREQRVGGAEPREGEPPRDPGQAADGDLALRVLEDVPLLLRGLLRIECKRGHRRDLHAAVELAEAGQHDRLAGHGLDPVVEEPVHGKADHVLERDGRAPLVEGRDAVLHRKNGEHDAVHLPRDGSAQLRLVHDPGLDQRLPEPPLALAAEQRGGLVVLLVGDAAERDQRLPQPVLLEVAGREHDPAVVEEEGLDRLAGLHLEVAAAARAGQGAQRLGDGGAGEVDQHAVPGYHRPNAGARARTRSRERGHPRT